MAPVCSVSGCTTRSKSKYKLITSEEEIPRIHRFPKDPVIQKLWVLACRKHKPINVSSAYVCSLHFSNEDYFKPLIQKMLNYSPQNCRKLKADAIPTLNLPGDELIQSNQVLVKTRESRTRSPRNSIFTVIECEESKSQDYSVPYCISSAEKSGTCLSSGSMTSVLNKRSVHSLKQRSPKFTVSDSVTPITNDSSVNYKLYRSGNSLKQRSPKFIVSDHVTPTNNDSLTILNSKNMTRSLVPCKRSLFNASADDIAMSDVDNSDEMASQLCVENINELDGVKELLKKCQTENIRLNSQNRRFDM